MPTLYDNKYEYIKELGEGGFGKVFLAREKVSKRLVAIKQLKDTDKQKQEDIIHEIEVVSKFENPNIVAYYHHFWQDELLFLVMEYCAGGNLRHKMKAGDLSATDIFNWMQTLAECLRIVHKKGIIHHDIKPDNILFSENGTIKISDFGIANTGAGTRAYMSPEALSWESNAKTDPRVDIYAVGVTLMELLTGKNPFFFQSKEQIIELHQKAEFPIKHLPHWQQEIILKAINKVPELRFQYMVELEEAIKAKAVPVTFNKEILKAAELVAYAEKAIKLKKWRNAVKYLELANNSYPDNVSVMQAFGKYYLLLQKIDKAKAFFEKSLRLNPRLDVQKDLGWIHLENQNYPIAISLLSDHLHRHPSDLEAYNLLLQCYYETNRYEAGIELARNILTVYPDNACFANNYYICTVMHNIGQTIFPDTILKAKNNAFIDYNFSIILESEPSHNELKKPTLKSKLLFMDYRFLKIAENTLHFIDSTAPDGKVGDTSKVIIKFGRQDYDVNDVRVPGGTSISRRHCLIINCKDDVWVYDLESTGTYLNDLKIRNKSPLLGLNKIRIGNTEYTITTDKSKLL